MREVTVKYLLDDETEQRLEKIAEEYRKQGMTGTDDRIFEIIMCTGSKHDIETKFKFLERKFGLREDLK